MPDMPVAAPAPAATPAPAPAPSAPSTPAPSPAPAPQSTPAPEVATPPAAAEITPAAPEEGIPVAPSGEPKQEDYAPTAEGLETFLNDRNKWREEHGEATEDPAVETTQPAPEQETTPEGEQQAAQPQDSSPTPQKLDEWTKKAPELNEIFTKYPELKGEFFGMARFNERAKPVLDLIPSVEEATFAIQNAGTLVDLRTGLMLAVEDPATLPQTFDKLQDLFRIKDADGNYVKDASGNFQMADDYSLLQNQFVGNALKSAIEPLKSKLEQLKQRVQSSVYPTPEAKSADEAALTDTDYAIAALEFAEKLLSPQESEIALPELPPDATPAQREFQENLKKQQEEIAKAKATNSKEQRVQARQAYKNKLDVSWRGGIGKMLDQAIKDERGRGGVIPDLILQEKWIDPRTNQQTNVSNFAMRVMLEFNDRVNKQLGVRQKLADLQMLPPGPEAEAAASSYYAELRSEYLQPIIQAAIDRVQKGLLQFQSQQSEQRGQVNRIANVEPNSGSTPSPVSMTTAQINAKAQANAEALPGYADMTPTEKLEAVMNQRYKLRGLM